MTTSRIPWKKPQPSPLGLTEASHVAAQVRDLRLRSPRPRMHLALAEADLFKRVDPLVRRLVRKLGAGRGEAVRADLAQVGHFAALTTAVDGFDETMGAFEPRAWTYAKSAMCVALAKVDRAAKLDSGDLELPADLGEAVDEQLARREEEAIQEQLIDALPTDARELVEAAANRGLRRLAVQRKADHRRLGEEAAVWMSDLQRRFASLQEVRPTPRARPISLPNSPPPRAQETNQMADATQAAGEHWITALAALPPGEALTVGEFCAQTGIGVRLARQSLNRLLGAAKVTESIRFGGGRGQPPKAYSLKGTR